MTLCADHLRVVGVFSLEWFSKVIPAKAEEKEKDGTIGPILIQLSGALWLRGASAARAGFAARAGVSGGAGRIDIRFSAGLLVG